MFGCDVRVNVTEDTNPRKYIDAPRYMGVYIGFAYLSRKGHTDAAYRKYFKQSKTAPATADTPSSSSGTTSTRIAKEFHNTLFYEYVSLRFLTCVYEYPTRAHLVCQNVAWLYAS